MLPPKTSALVVSFWIFSLLFGVAAAVWDPWSFPLLLTWLLLAILAVTVMLRARTTST